MFLKVTFLKFVKLTEEAIYYGFLETATVNDDFELKFRRMRILF